jgi:hypothetical protein
MQKTTAEHTPSVPMDERRRLCCESCTLDGKPAVIMGALNDFATVAAFPVGPSYEWAWSTVARVVAAGGMFRGNSDSAPRAPGR